MKLPEIEDLLPDQEGDLEASDVLDFFRGCTIQDVESKIVNEPYYAVTCFENVGRTGMEYYAPAVASFVKTMGDDESADDILGRFLYCFRMRGVSDDKLKNWGLI